MIIRKSRIGEGYDRDFDIRFWQELSSKQRADAVWQMVEEYWQMKQRDPDELRLQRSVENIQRNGR